MLEVAHVARRHHEGFRRLYVMYIYLLYTDIKMFDISFQHIALNMLYSDIMHFVIVIGFIQILVYMCILQDIMTILIVIL